MKQYTPNVSNRCYHARWWLKREKGCMRIVEYVKYNKLLNNNKEDILAIADFGHVAWILISSIYKGGWDKVKTKN